MASDGRAGWRMLRTSAHAWQLDPDDISPGALERQCAAWLSPQERRKWKSLRTAGARHTFLAARALCRATLSRYTGVEPQDWRFGTNAFGKPRILLPARFRTLQFNVAHANGLVICLVSRAGAVGVDVEETSRAADVEAIARHFFSRRERALLDRLPQRQRVGRFFKQWVVKEAYLKGIGTGLAHADERLTIPFASNGRPLTTGRWRFHLHRPTDRHVAAAAVRQRPGAAGVRMAWFKTAGFWAAR